MLLMTQHYLRYRWEKYAQAEGETIIFTHSMHSQFWVMTNWTPT